MTASDHPALVRRARWLARFTIGYNLVEGFAATGFGAGDGSVALFGFGIDSFIEVASAAMVLWRLRVEFAGTPGAATRERTAGMWVSGLLVLLGVGTIAGSAWRLCHHGRPETAFPALVIALLSLSFMFWLWRSKRAVAAALDSRTLRQDAACSLGCIQLSLTLLAGSLLYLLVPGLWWADGAAAIIIALLIARDGWHGFQAARQGSGGCGCGHACP